MCFGRFSDISRTSTALEIINATEQPTKMFTKVICLRRYKILRGNPELPGPFFHYRYIFSQSSYYREKTSLQVEKHFSKTYKTVKSWALSQELDVFFQRVKKQVKLISKHEDSLTCDIVPNNSTIKTHIRLVGLTCNLRMLDFALLL